MQEIHVPKKEKKKKKEKETESARIFKQAYCSAIILRREKWQDEASCDKNSDKCLHRMQVELEGS